jgi:V8-like Glu-specific endopeptidase
MEAAELLTYEDPHAAASRPLRPFVTESARALIAEPGASLQITTEDGVHLLSGVVQQGRAGQHAVEDAAETRTLAERRESAAAQLAGVAQSEGTSSELGEAHRPDGLALGVRPTLVSTLGGQRFGISSRGGKTLLSEAPHSTIINGESRQYVYPNTYPFTAVCKLYCSWQPSAGAAWLGAGEATGYMIGRQTLMTSGHVGPPTNGASWAIQVIPACWNGQSLFGAGAVSWVAGYHSWNSDSGSDIKICQLFDPIGDQVGYFGYRGYSSSWEDGEYWTMAGFPYDRSLTYMSYEDAIAVRDDDDGDDINVDGHGYDTTQVESDADEASGASGSPLWGWWDGTPQAIGVHHGVEYDGTVWGTETLSCASGGSGFTQACAWGRRLWG